jgi:hypothetical protein
MALQAHHHRNASQVETLIHPTRGGIREELRKKGVMPRDHEADNKALIREMQHIASARRAEELCPRSSERFILPEFSKVESKLKQSHAMDAPATEAPSSARRSQTAAGIIHLMFFVLSQRPTFFFFFVCVEALPTRFIRKDASAPKPAVPRASEVIPMVRTVAVPTKTMLALDFPVFLMYRHPK